MDAERVDHLAATSCSLLADLDLGRLRGLCRVALCHRKAPPDIALQVVARRACTGMFPRRTRNVLNHQRRRSRVGADGYHGSTQVARNAQTPRPVCPAVSVDLPRNVVVASRTVLVVRALHGDKPAGHHDRLVAHVCRGKPVCAPEFCYGRTPAALRSSTRNRHVGLLPTPLSSVLVRAHRSEPGQLGT